MCNTRALQRRVSEVNYFTKTQIDESALLAFLTMIDEEGYIVPSVEMLTQSLVDGETLFVVWSKGKSVSTRIFKFDR